MGFSSVSQIVDRVAYLQGFVTFHRSGHAFCTALNNKPGTFDIFQTHVFSLPFFRETSHSFLNLTVETLSVNKTNFYYKTNIFRYKMLHGRHQTRIYLSVKVSVVRTKCEFSYITDFVTHFTYFPQLKYPNTRVSVKRFDVLKVPHGQERLGTLGL